MTAIFADTFYGVALTNVRDSAQFSRSLSSASLVTTEPVLIEYLDYSAAWGPEFRLMASASANSMVSSSSVKVLPLTAELFEAGVDLYAARPDKGYSLTDCTSMVAMRRQGLSQALTNDQHFDQGGPGALSRFVEGDFLTVPRPCFRNGKF